MNMRILAFGDIHMSLDNFHKIPGMESADLLIITGDLTNFGHRDDAEKIISQIRQVNNRILAMAGNLDHPDVDTYLTEEDINLHSTGKIIQNVGIFGVGGSNPTPFNTPNEYSENELEAFCNVAYEKVKNTNHHILVSHTPPHATKTDMLRNGAHVGSKVLRAFLEKRQPDLCLTGHIHESKAEDAIGRTMIINPGMIRDGGFIEVICEHGGINATLKTL